MKKDGTEDGADVYSKFGASTTNMNKLLHRLNAGRNGGCPILVVGLQTTAFLIS
ncbi:MAG: BglII/BstYI family type II restriction endonuclease [Pseudomonadota bacterium]